MSGEGEEWVPLIRRAFSRIQDSEFDLEKADSIRAEMKKEGLNPGAIALMLLQFEDADPSVGRQNNEIDGYC